MVAWAQWVGDSQHAIGAKAAKPEVPVVDIAGDGSFGMTENNLATAVEEELPVIVVVLNNNVLGMVAQWQRYSTTEDTALSSSRATQTMVKLADAYGAEGVRVETLDDFRTSRLGEP